MKRHVLASMMACAGLALLGIGLLAAAPPPGNPDVFPPNSHPYGHSYAQWSARSGQWGLGLPGNPYGVCDSPAGHPYLDCPNFDVTEGQTGKVWFLAGVFGAVTRTCTIPAGKALFVTLASAEASSLEAAPFGSQTEAGQRAIANCFIDHVVVGSLFCTIDGHPVSNLSAFRFESPQYTFTAPTPWIFGDIGGTGTSVADGYYVFLKPLDAGQHVLHFGSALDGMAGCNAGVISGAIDMTYNLTQL